MQKITTESELRAAILLLESKQAEQGQLLKEQFYMAYESIKPINLAISALKEAAASSELKDNLFNTSVGLGAGYISKLLFQSGAGGPIGRMLGSALMFSITNLVTKNPDAIKSMGKGLFRIIRSKMDKQHRDSENESN